MRYISYLATIPPLGAAGSPHVAHEVKMQLIRMWGPVSKTRKIRKCLHLFYIKIKNLINKFNLLFPPIAT
jgi:hypothetical protein